MYSNHGESNTLQFNIWSFYYFFLKKILKLKFKLESDLLTIWNQIQIQLTNQIFELFKFNQGIKHTHTHEERKRDWELIQLGEK